MKNTMKVLSVLLALAVFLIRPVPAGAQTDGRFAGTVLDQTGAFAPGATVTARNERTGEERTVTADAQGRYLVANLRPASYTVRATFGNFAPLEYTA
jgi:hypothetical protein